MSHIFDIEVYPNYFLAIFRDVKTKDVKLIEIFDDEQLNSCAIPKELIGFNSTNYDLPILSAQQKGLTNSEIKEISDDIIKNGLFYWNTYEKYELKELRLVNIDLQKILGGFPTKLKSYGGRLNTPKLENLPIPPSTTLTRQQADKVKSYCLKDLDITQRLYDALATSITIRRNLGNWSLCKSDPQIAEKLICTNVGYSNKTSKVLSIKYTFPDWVDLDHPIIEVIRNIDFDISSDTGQLLFPKELGKPVELQGRYYKMGIGGLHSQEKRQRIEADDDQYFAEYDVSSMYPSIILNEKIIPSRFDKAFLSYYQQLYDQRIQLKKQDKPSDMQKLQLNGIFGKMGSKYSKLYCPKSLLQITLTGQLSLLMLIDAFEKEGVSVVSANTDGVNVLASSKDVCEKVRGNWEKTTKLNLDCSQYSKAYSRDVNNYIVVKSNGGIKTKGVFASPSLSKNPTNHVCVTTVVNYLTKDIPIRTSLFRETDMFNFLTLRRVTGGGMYKAQELGNVIRYYHSLDGDVITYTKNNNKVPKSDGCEPLMDVSELKSNIDYKWYEKECIDLLKHVGVMY